MPPFTLPPKFLLIAVSVATADASSHLFNERTNLGEVRVPKSSSTLFGLDHVVERLRQEVMPWCDVDVPNGIGTHLPCPHFGEC